MPRWGRVASVEKFQLAGDLEILLRGEASLEQQSIEFLKDGRKRVEMPHVAGALAGVEEQFGRLLPLTRVREQPGAAAREHREDPRVGFPRVEDVSGLLAADAGIRAPPCSGADGVDVHLVCFQEDFHLHRVRRR